MAERRTGTGRSGSGRAAGRGRTARSSGAGPAPRKAAGRTASNPLLGDGAREAAVAAVRAEHPTCTVGFCPICLVVTTIGDARPDLIEHLLVAGRELLLAARAVIDARLESMDEQEPSSGIQRITIE